jgi:hypothetical protein
VTDFSAVVLTPLMAIISEFVAEGKVFDYIPRLVQKKPKTEDSQKREAARQKLFTGTERSKAGERREENGATRRTKPRNGGRAAAVSSTARELHRPRRGGATQRPSRPAERSERGREAKGGSTERGLSERRRAGGRKSAARHLRSDNDTEGFAFSLSPFE